MTISITEITQRAGAGKRRKRVGRGESSGHGKTSGRGNKGLGARAGGKRQNLREGGMLPLFRRVPKFGFSNVLFRQEYQVVNVGDLEVRFDEGSRVTAAALEEMGLIRDHADPVKILGDGDLKKKLAVEAHRFSASATAKIEAAGGTANWLGPKPKKKFVKRPKPAPEPAPAAPEGKKAKASAKADEKAEKPPQEKKEKKEKKEKTKEAKPEGGKQPE